MSKRNVAFIKPQEPAFLRRLKEQVGYKEGPTVETKREKLEYCSDDSDGEDQPTVVVVSPGDLTADEVEHHKKEVEEAKANLADRVIFRRPGADKRKLEDKETKPSVQNKETKKKKKTEGTATKSLLSFDDEEEES